MTMDTEKFDRLERLLDRALFDEEKARLCRIQDILGIKDNDGMWDVLIALEYQRNYYDELPKKISQAAAEIFKGLSQAAEKEVALAQGRLAESVVEQAKNLSLKTYVHTWVIWGTIALVLLLLFGGLLLWAGYSIGSGQIQPPALLLRMPVGIIVGGLSFGWGLFGGALAAKHFAEGSTIWRKYLFASLCCIVAGGWIFSLVVF